MKLCFYSPYFTNHHSGGGEKHLFDTAVTAANLGHSVSVSVTLPTNMSFRPDPELVEEVVGKSEIKLRNSNSNSRLDTVAKTDLSASLHSAQDDAFLDKTKNFYEDFLGYSLQNITFIATPLHTNAGFFTKLLWTKQFDGLYYVTDGSLFFSLAKKNYLHIQIPFTSTKHSLIERLKLANWQHKNTNSEFTKHVIEKRWNTSIDLVHYPLINTSEFKPSTKKEKIILSVGRFFTQLHAKRQDVTIDIFKQFVDKYPQLAKGWKLVLTGAVEDEKYLESLKRKVKNLPVEFRHDLQRSELVELFNKSQFYIHSAGYDINEQKNPEKVEHFGITTVEAMAAGCIPLAHNKGGQREILQGGLEELLWENKDDAVEKLAVLVKEQRSKYKDQLKKAIQKRVSDFGQEQFNYRVEKMFF